MGRELRRVMADQAARRPASVDQAAERAHRGRALVDAALLAAQEGRPAPALTAAAPPTGPAPRVEATACRSCYAPHEAPPDTLCARCATNPRSQPFDDLLTSPP